MKQHIDMELIAHQLSANLLHILLRILKIEAQDPRKQSQCIRLNDGENGMFAHTPNLF